MPKNNPTPNVNNQLIILHLDHHIGSRILTNYYRTIPKFKINSTIIVQDNIAISNEIIFHTNHNSKSNSPLPQLLYRGSRDGFKSKDFHSRCDNQGPTLIVIKSEEHNQIFGGFTTQSWKSSPVGFISDSSAFIFKIENSNQNQYQIFRKFNIKQNRKQCAIRSYAHELPVFGVSDIYIYNYCNLNNSFSNFGNTYELPPNTEYESINAKTYLAGSRYFKVSEIEVFKIIQ